MAIRLYLLLIQVASLWNSKAKAWLQGRKDWQQQLKNNLHPGRPVIWVHCSSAGEFEQGKPLIEALKKNYPGHQVLLSFFSPSGWVLGKKYAFADAIIYLPADTNKNAKEFISTAKPELAIFVKYDFWYHYFQAIAFRHIPLLLVSVVFRKEQSFFQWWGSFFKKMLYLPRQTFVQDEMSLKLLQQAGIGQCSISGDTRFDRVHAIAQNVQSIEKAEIFIGDSPVLVAGSTWAGDEEALQTLHGVKLIIAPHEISESRLAQIETLFPDAVRYSLFSKADAAKNVLIIDNIGMLSRLYSYGHITYVGGGFTRDGIHNSLEAAVWGKPVLFGPNYKKYREATELIAYGGAMSFSSGNELQEFVYGLLKDENKQAAMGRQAKNYIEKNTGATEKIIRFIQEKRLLTNS